MGVGSQDGGVWQVGKYAVATEREQLAEGINEQANRDVISISIYKTQKCRVYVTIGHGETPKMQLKV